MLRSCVCFRRGSSKRRSSSLEDSSSCRSSEIERGGASLEPLGSGRGASGASSLLQLFHSKGWYRHWRKPGRNMSMTKIERTMKAALLIQRWYRRYLARMEMRKRYTWSIFQNLEYAGEQDQVELYKFFEALLIHIPEATKAHSLGSSKGSLTETVDFKLADDYAYPEDDFGPEGAYKGPHLAFPLVKKDIDTLIDLFRKKKNNHLHAKYVAGILREAAIRLKRQPNLNQASTAISKQVTVVGDLHGKLDDLLVIFHKNGLPSVENPYIFNGDFVDRGKKSIEVFLLLLATFLVFTGGVYLNRGNHEDSVMNARYGFTREVHDKYKGCSEKLLKLIDEVFRWLPLGTIINNRVLTVHGGISDTTNLDLIKSLDRGKYVSILRPPIDNTEGIDKVEWKQLFDIMWSDPMTNDGCEPNSLRGAGTYFGPDVSDVFLKKNKLKYLIRSHECKPDGYEFVHNDKVITIFSASNYYAIGSNKGAYLKFNPQLEPRFVQYISAASKSAKLTFRQKVGIIESSALRELGGRLREKRDILEAEFYKYDPKKTGIISVQNWCDAMETATNLGLPWRMLRDKLAPMPDTVPHNEAHYNATLALLDTDIIIAQQEDEISVADSLYKNKSSLEAIFHILDKDNSGYISLEEFEDAIELLQRYLPGNTHESLLNMCKLMDINQDGQVDLNEFLEAFRLSDKARKKIITVSTPKANPGAKAQLDMDVSERQTVSKVAATLGRQESLGDMDIDPRDHEAKALDPVKKSA